MKADTACGERELSSIPQTWNNQYHSVRSTSFRCSVGRNSFPSPGYSSQRCEPGHFWSKHWHYQSQQHLSKWSDFKSDEMETVGAFSLKIGHCVHSFLGMEAFDMSHCFAIFSFFLCVTNMGAKTCVPLLFAIRNIEYTLITASPWSHWL